MVSKEKYVEQLKEYKECCGTCQFNFGGVCAGGDNETGHHYGHDIIDLEDFCDGYDTSIEAFCKFNIRHNYVNKNDKNKAFIVVSKGIIKKR